MEKLRFDLSARSAVLTAAERTVLTRLNAIETDPYELYYKDGTLIQAEFSGVASFWRHSAKLQEDKALVIVYEPGKYEVSEEGVQPTNEGKEGPQGVPQPPHIDDSVEDIKKSLRHMGMRDDDPFLLAEIQRKQAARRAVYQEAVRRAEEKAREAALKQQEEERVAAEKARQEAERKAQWLRTRGKAGAETASPAAPQLPPRPPVSAAGGGTAVPAPPARPTASSKVHRDRDYSGVAAPAPVTAAGPRPPAPSALAPPPPPSTAAAPVRPKSPPRPAAPAATPPKPVPAHVASKAHRDRDYAAPVGVTAPPTSDAPNPRPPMPETKPASALTAGAASNRMPRDRDYSSSSASAQPPIATQQSAGPSGVPKAASRDNSSAPVRDTKQSSHAERAKAPKDRDYAAAAAPRSTPTAASNSAISAARVAAAAAVIDKDKTSAGNALANAGALGVGREGGVPHKPANASNRSAPQAAAAAYAPARSSAAPAIGQKEQSEALKTAYRSGSRDRPRPAGEPAKSAAHSETLTQVSVGDKRHRSHSRDRPSNKAPALSGAPSGAPRRGDSRERRQHSRERGPSAQGYRGGDISRGGGYGRESSGSHYETDEFGRERVVSSGTGHNNHGGGDRDGTGRTYAASHQRHQQEKYYGGNGGGGGGGYRRN
jgi:hypothetical protein